MDQFHMWFHLLLFQELANLEKRLEELKQEEMATKDAELKTRQDRFQAKDDMEKDVIYVAHDIII